MSTFYIPNLRSAFAELGRQTFAACPERTVQWRTARRTQNEPPFLQSWDTLWRTDECCGDRWHWRENPCRCNGYNGSHLDTYVALGYRIEHATPERGTWRRDGKGIASFVQRYREDLRKQHEADAAGRAAVGPRKLGKLTSLPLGRAQRKWLEETGYWLGRP